jgi:hypothetical protein
VKKEIKEIVKRGDKIKIADDRMMVFSKSEKKGEIERRNNIPVCIDFQ